MLRSPTAPAGAVPARFGAGTSTAHADSPTSPPPTATATVTVTALVAASASPLCHRPCRGLDFERRRECVHPLPQPRRTAMSDRRFKVFHLLSGPTINQG